MTLQLNSNLLLATTLCDMFICNYALQSEEFAVCRLPDAHCASLKISSVFFRIRYKIKPLYVVSHSAVVN